MKWIRIACKIRGSVSIQQMASALKLRRNEALGCVVSLLCALPDHAPDGDVSRIPDESLEQWAGWHGARGRFAAAFRAELCTDDGRVRTWDEYNGGAIREAERSRKNVAAYRERKRDVSGDVIVNVTERNETVRTAVAVPCDSKKQLHQLPPGRTTRGQGGITPIGAVVRAMKPWDRA